MVGGAAGVVLVVSGLILARHPLSRTARVHAAYGATAAWWLFSMSMIAGAESIGRAQLWARLAQLGIGMLPGVIYHVNVSTAGLARERRRQIRVYYGLSIVVTVFGLTWPDLLTSPHVYSWGYYPAYTAWGIVPVALLLVVFAEALRAYREAMRRFAPGSPHYQRARAFYLGNYLAYLAVIDFLPAFGVAVYPFGFVLIVAMFAATMVGAMRYRLIEITPEIAAERILETIPEGLIVVDTQNTIRLANGAAADLLNGPLAHLRDRPLKAVVSDPGLARVFEGEGNDEAEVVMGDAGGTNRHVVVTSAAVRDSWGEHLGRLWLLRDLTEQRRAEAEKHHLEDSLRQTQKMESLGVMAGGIAHDFNNILMAILGSAQAAGRKIAAGAPVDEELQTIVTAVDHAAGLTDQLLTYAGRGPSADRPLDLNTLISEMAGLLRSAASKKARLDLDLAPDLPWILGDQSQLRQVVLNLVTNASEALGEGPGNISVRTSASETGDADRRVQLEVIDTGVGMDLETRARIFDPFFTTKFEGRGLGLATVLGIVQRQRGVIGVCSVPGRGTRFEVSLPALLEPPAPARPVSPEADTWKGSGRVLLVDDEATVRLVVRQMLDEMGFTVVEAADGVEAVGLFDRDDEGFGLVVLDVTMPRMTGTETLAALRARASTLPAVLISGHSVSHDEDQVRDPRTVFLHKPFRQSMLATRIREAMTGTVCHEVIRSVRP